MSVDLYSTFAAHAIGLKEARVGSLIAEFQLADYRTIPNRLGMESLPCFRQPDPWSNIGKYEPSWNIEVCRGSVTIFSYMG